ncbi:MAG: UDP-glucose/GDP-mannose dehydrogenase family protein [Magnetospirillum sp.]|nr:UDP-glucose/GDP-mannose dehydrogenase family protein [Magnetospirillum sp.]
MHVAMVGTGYVGLVSGACLAAIGHSVACVDADPVRVDLLSRGECPIHEDGLDRLIREGMAAGRLGATTDLAAAMDGAQVVIVAVGTPSLDGRIDLSAVEAAAHQVGLALRGRRDRPVVAVKSTVVPGTTATLVRRALEEASGGRAGREFGLAMNPEFLSQGSAVTDFLHPDRIVVGEWDPRSGELMAELYRPLAAPLLRMGLAEAEMVKYAANSLQALLISYANQIAALCEALPGADHRRVMAAVHLDRMLDGPEGRRAGATRFLMGGIGFGGSCFPKDLQALTVFAHRLGVPVPLIAAISAVNAVRPAQALHLLSSRLGGLFERRVAVLGLTFKPGTDDLRESPGLKLIDRLRRHGAEVLAHDPLPQARTRARDAGLPVADRVEDALAGANAVIIATAWPQYRQLAWSALGEVVVLDGRNLLDGLDLPASLQVVRMGAGPVSPEVPTP